MPGERRQHRDFWAEPSPAKAANSRMCCHWNNRFLLLTILLSMGISYLASVGFRARSYFSEVREGRHCLNGIIHQPDRELGYAPIPGARGEHVLPIGPPVPTRFDEHGLRVPVDDERRILKNPIILTLGCSFTYGEACEAEDTYPYLLAERLGGTELNAGACAYGLTQMVLRARELIPRWKPQFVVVQYSPWLTHRATSCFARSHSARLPVPYFTDGEDGGVSLHEPAFLALAGTDLSPYQKGDDAAGYLRFLWEVGIPRFFHDDFHYLTFRSKLALGLVPEPTKRKGAVVSDAYREIRDLCHEHDASMVVVLMGRGPEEIVVPPELAKLGVTIVDAHAKLLSRLPSLDLDTYRKAYAHLRGDPPVFVDWHPNPHAHALVADALARQIGPEWSEKTRNTGVSMDLRSAR
jgi:hypothetical protein